MDEMALRAAPRKEPQMRSPKYTNLGLWVLFFWGGAAIAIYAAGIPLGFDESYNLNLALTIAEYNRYASHFADGFRHFDPAISTGPHLLIWLGIWFKFVNASFELARGFMGVLFLLSLFFLYRGIAIWNGIRAGVIAVIGILCLPYVLFWGVSAQGDIWALGWLFLSLFFFAKSIKAQQNQQRWLWMGASGISLGLVFLTKITFLLIFPAWGLSALLGGLQKRSWKMGWLQVMPVVIALGMLGAWNRFQSLVLRWFAEPQTYLQWLQSNQARSALMWQAVIWDPFSHSRQALVFSMREYGPVLAIFGMAALFVIFQRSANEPLWNFQNPFDRIALLGAGTWFFWFYFLSGVQANNRHLFPGYVFLVILFVKVLVKLFPVNFSSPNWPRVVMLGVMVLFFCWSLFNGIRFDYQVYQYGRAQIVNQQTVADWVRQHVPEDEPVAGLGWFVPWDISFLANRLPMQADINSEPAQNLTKWFILTPEVEATGNLTPSILQRLDTLGELVFQQDGYLVFLLDVK